MRSRRLACLLLGIWMGAGIWMYLAASQSASNSDEVMLRGPAAVTAAIKTVGRSQTFELARYLAAVQAKSLYETWGTVQIALAAILFLFLLFGTKLGKFPLALGLLLTVFSVAERLLLYPDLGAAAGMLGENSRRAEAARQALNYGYLGAESLKWILLVVLAAFLVWEQSRRSRDSRHQVNVVNKADDRHVNR